MLIFCLALLFCSPGSAQESEPEDDESRERLIRRTRGEEDEDLMAGIIRQMNEVQQRLEEFFDAGPDTQETQERILKQLDEAIEQARQQLRAQQSAPPEEGDPRQGGEVSDQQGATPEDAQGGSESDSAQGGSADPTEAATQGALHDRQRQWGNLPPRDREEVDQGSNEEVLDKYRELINRYYEALAQPAEKE